MIFRKGKRIKIAAAAAAVGLLVILISAWLYLPLYLKDKLLPDLVRKIDLTLEHIEIRRIGWTGAELAMIRISKNQASVLELSAIQIGYTPWELLQRKISAITLVGPRVEVTIDDQGVTVAGWNILSGTTQTAATDYKPLRLETLLPLEIKTISLRDGMIILNWRQHIIEGAFNMKLAIGEFQNGMIQAAMAISSRGNKVEATANFDNRTGKTLLKVTDLDLNPESFSDLLKEVAPLVFKGTVHLVGQCEVQINPFQLNTFSGQVAFSQLGISGYGITLENTQTPQGHDQPLVVSLQADTPQHWQWTSSPFQLSHPAYTLLPEIRINAQRITDHWELSATGGPVRVRLPDAELVAPSIALTGQAVVADQTHLQADIHLPKPVFTHTKASAQADQIALTIDVQSNQDQPWQARGQLEIMEGQVDIPSQEFKLHQLSIQLPVEWPRPAKGAEGRIKAGLQWKNQAIGSFTGTLQPYADGLRANLTHLSQLLPGMNVFILADAQPSGIRLDLNLPNYRPDKEIDMGRFFPAAAGVTLRGRLQAQAELAIDGPSVKGKGRPQLDQGRLNQGSSKLALDEISIALAFDQLPSLRSASRQKLKIAALQLGDIAAEDLNADFQIETDGSLLFEKVSLKWCEGTIKAQSIRIRPQSQDLDITLFCDQLNLAKVLEQLGVAEGDGQGVISGQLPIRWTQKRLYFDDGLLTSTPGQTGTIHLRNTETFLQGLAPGTPQHTQLDIATEALKDYTYDWAKLRLHSQQEILLVSLQLDGRPNRLLPFSYDPSQGMFKRFEGKGQAEFKGIRIDLNFQSPINQLLRYKELLKPNEPRAQ